MKKTIILTGLTVIFLSGSTQAANLAVITSPPTILNILVFLFACACLYLCTQLLKLVKGGHLSKAWQVFMLSFLLLALSQIASLLDVFEVILLPNFVVPVLLTVMAGLFLYGIYETKRVLS